MLLLLPHVTGALAACRTTRPYTDDAETLALTKLLVADSDCFNVRDVSKLGLLVFGDTPITRVIKDSWVGTFAAVVAALQAAVFNTVRILLLTVTCTPDMVEDYRPLPDDCDLTHLNEL